MTGNELRQKYLQFFASKEHLILPSYPLIPENDPTLLLIGAGMAPFKPFFTGKMKYVDTAGRGEKFQRKYNWDKRKKAGETKEEPAK